MNGQRPEGNSFLLDGAQNVNRMDGGYALKIPIDTVLIAAAFCMYNRYVDGLATWAPKDPAAYAAMGARLAEQGYLAPGPASAEAAHAR